MNSLINDRAGKAIIYLFRLRVTNTRLNILFDCREQKQ